MAQISTVMHIEDRLNELFVLLSLVEEIWKKATPKQMHPSNTAFHTSWKGLEALATHRKSWARESVLRIWLVFLEQVGINELLSGASEGLLNKDNVQRFGELVLETMRSYDLSESLAEVALRSLVLFSSAIYQLFVTLHSLENQKRGLPIGEKLVKGV